MHTLSQRIRRIHALEHATMHLLPCTATRGRLMGRSDWGGFTLYGEAETPAVAAAAHKALAQLQAGQRHLAIHPNCGTNVAVGGLLAIAAGWLALSSRRRAARGVLAGLLMTLALGASEPLGMLAQARLTTDADLTGWRIGEITRERRHGLVRHRIIVREG